MGRIEDLPTVEVRGRMGSCIPRESPPLPRRPLPELARLADDRLGSRLPQVRVKTPTSEDPPLFQGVLDDFLGKRGPPRDLGGERRGDLLVPGDEDGNFPQPLP